MPTPRERLDSLRSRKRLQELRAIRDQQPVDPRIALQDLIIEQSKAPTDARQQEITALRGKLGTPDTDRSVSGFEQVQTEQPSGSIGSFGRGVKQGVLNVGSGALGAGAEALGAVGVDTGQFQQDLEASRGIDLQRTKQITEEAPISGFVGELVGEVASLPFPAARTAKVAAGLGAGTGALVAEGTDRDPLTGAAIGGVFGGVLSKAEKLIRGRALSKASSDEQVKKLIQEAVPDTRILGKELVEDITTGTSKIVNNKTLSKLAKTAEKEGFSLGTLAIGQSSNKSTKTGIRNMLGIINKGITNDVFRKANRPADIVGKALKKRIDVAIRVNRKAGKDINRIAEKELRGVRVDASDSLAGLRDDLSTKLDVTFTNGVPNFGESFLSTSTTSQNIIKDLLRKTRSIDKAAGPTTGIDGERLHKLKRFVDSKINFGKKSEGGIDDIEPLLKGFRKSINDTLRAKSKSYAKANDNFVDSIKQLEPFEQITGKAVDLEKPGAEAALGRILRREMGNAQSRELIMNSRKSLDQFAKKHGSNFTDDIEKLNNVAMAFEMMFKGQAPASVRGQLGADAVEFATAGTLGKAKVLAGKVLENTPDEKKAVKAFQQFLNSGGN